MTLRSFSASILVVVSTLLGASGAAHADLLPGRSAPHPAGYRFQVNGLSKAPDRIVLAYPCLTSEASPIDELRPIVDGESITITRGAGTCTLHTMSLAAYTDWTKTLGPRGPMTPAASQAFTSLATKCNGGPTPTFGAHGSTNTEVFDLETATTTECVLVSRGLSTSPSEPNADGGCSVSPCRNARATWVVALVVSAILLRARRSRASGRGDVVRVA